MADTDETRRWLPPSTDGGAVDPIEATTVRPREPGTQLTWNSGPAPSSGLAIALDRREAISRQEHRDAVQRFRFVATAALFIWPAFALLDPLVVTLITPGPLWGFLALRGVGIVLLIALVITLRRVDPGPRMLKVLDLVAFGGMAVLVAALTVLSGGFKSSYANGIILLMLGRAATLAEPWRRGLLPYLLMWLSFPAAQLIGALFVPELADQLHDARAMALFTVHNGFIGGAAMLGVLMSHIVYTVRHQAYASSKLGRYQLRKRLGVGGMGEVWIAHHQTLRRDVALKVLKPELGLSAESIQRFEREVVATTRLTHPNTIRIMDHGVTPEGLWYYAMELLDGVDLGELVRRDGPLPPARAIHLLRQACGSLAEAHRMGFVHRDVKPENLYVATLGGVEDFVKVLDFGIAKVSQDLEDTQLTRDGAVAGTPMYLSPEVIQGEPADPRADVYSLGCVLYVTLCGRPVFEVDTVVAMLMNHIHESPQPPSEKLGQPLPADLEAVVLRCLAKDPDDRFADAGALGDALAACTDATPAA